MSVTVNNKEVDLGSIELFDVDTRDYPDFCDAYIGVATFVDGSELTEDECEKLQAACEDMISELAFESLL